MCSISNHFKIPKQLVKDAGAAIMSFKPFSCLTKKSTDNKNITDLPTTNQASTNAQKTQPKANPLKNCFGKFFTNRLTQNAQSINNEQSSTQVKSEKPQGKIAKGLKTGAKKTGKVVKFALVKTIAPVVGIIAATTYGVSATLYILLKNLLKSLGNGTKFLGKKTSKYTKTGAYALWNGTGYIVKKMLTNPILASKMLTQMLLQIPLKLAFDLPKSAIKKITRVCTTLASTAVHLSNIVFKGFADLFKKEDKNISSHQINNFVKKLVKGICLMPFLVLTAPIKLADTGTKLIAQLMKKIPKNASQAKISTFLSKISDAIQTFHASCAKTREALLPKLRQKATRRHKHKTFEHSQHASAINELLLSCINDDHRHKDIANSLKENLAPSQQTLTDDEKNTLITQTKKEYTVIEPISKKIQKGEDVNPEEISLLLAFKVKHTRNFNLSVPERNFIFDKIGNLSHELQTQLANPEANAEALKTTKAQLNEYIHLLNYSNDGHLMKKMVHEQQNLLNHTAKQLEGTRPDLANSLRTGLLFNSKAFNAEIKVALSFEDKTSKFNEVCQKFNLDPAELGINANMSYRAIKEKMQSYDLIKDPNLLTRTIQKFNPIKTDSDSDSLTDVYIRQLEVLNNVAVKKAIAAIPILAKDEIKVNTAQTPTNAISIHADDSFMQAISAQRLKDIHTQPRNSKFTPNSMLKLYLQNRGIANNDLNQTSQTMEYVALKNDNLIMRNAAKGAAGGIMLQTVGGGTLFGIGLLAASAAFPPLKPVAGVSAIPLLGDLIINNPLFATVGSGLGAGLGVELDKRKQEFLNHIDTEKLVDLQEGIPDLQISNLAERKGYPTYGGMKQISQTAGKQVKEELTKPVNMVIREAVDKGKQLAAVMKKIYDIFHKFLRGRVISDALINTQTAKIERALNLNAVFKEPSQNISANTTSKKEKTANTTSKKEKTFTLDALKGIDAWTHIEGMDKKADQLRNQAKLANTFLEPMQKTLNSMILINGQGDFIKDNKTKTLVKQMVHYCNSHLSVDIFNQNLFLQRLSKAQLEELTKIFNSGNINFISELMDQNKLGDVNTLKTQDANTLLKNVQKLLNDALKIKQDNANSDFIQINAASKIENAENTEGTEIEGTEIEAAEISENNFETNKTYIFPKSTIETAHLASNTSHSRNKLMLETEVKAGEILINNAKPLTPDLLNEMKVNEIRYVQIAKPNTNGKENATVVIQKINDKEFKLLGDGIGLQLTGKAQAKAIQGKFTDATETAESPKFVLTQPAKHSGIISPVGSQFNLNLATSTY